MDLLKTCENYFNPQKLIDKSEKEGGWKTVKAGLVITSYIFVLPPIIMGALYGGATFAKWLKSDDPAAIKANNIGHQHLTARTDSLTDRFNESKEAIIEQLKISSPSDDIKNLTIEKLTDHFANDFAGLDNDTINFCITLALPLTSHIAMNSRLKDKDGHLNQDGNTFIRFLDAAIPFAEKYKNTDDSRFQKLTKTKEFLIPLLTRHRDAFKKAQSLVVK